MVSPVCPVGPSTASEAGQALRKFPMVWLSSQVACGDNTPLKCACTLTGKISQGATLPGSCQGQWGLLQRTNTADLSQVSDKLPHPPFLLGAEPILLSNLFLKHKAKLKTAGRESSRGRITTVNGG